MDVSFDEMRLCAAYLYCYCLDSKRLMGKCCGRQSETFHRNFPYKWILICSAHDQVSFRHNFACIRIDWSERLVNMIWRAVNFAPNIKKTNKLSIFLLRIRVASEILNNVIMKSYFFEYPIKLKIIFSIALHQGTESSKHMFNDECDRNSVSKTNDFSINLKYYILLSK